MKIQLDDPRLTAYALNEMDERERAAFEALLKEDADAQREADAIRETSELLVSELAKEPLAALSSTQRRCLDKTIVREARSRADDKPGAASWTGRWLRAALIPLALGLVAVGVLSKMGSPGDKIQPFTYMLDGADEGHAAPQSVSNAARASGSPEYVHKTGLVAPNTVAPAHAPAAPGASATAAAVQTQQDFCDAVGQLYDLGYVDTEVTGDHRTVTSCIAKPSGLPPGTEAYGHFAENRFLTVADEPLSTFSIDVDTASYANVRRFLKDGSLPPQDVVRVEELLNYFKYDYPQPRDEKPFSVNVEINPCPWNTENLLARIGLQGKNVAMDDRPPCNIVFLLDVSGSMGDANKLPLLVKAMKVLVDALSAQDRIGVVTYNETPRVILEPTSCQEKGVVFSALDQLHSGGSTNGAGGILLAYDVAHRTFLTGGINRVVLATDGDFNVGMDNTNELVQMIAQQAKSGVFLNVLGFGTGNLKDTNLQGLADKGNGQYAYIDSFNEARRVLLDKIAGTLVTIAKDVKIQVEFNPGKVGAYRLIGYEKRALAAKDFNDDTKDAGEIGAGHTVTALYELVPVGKSIPTPNVDALKYQPNNTPTPPAAPTSTSTELMTVKLRYKAPASDTSARFDVPVENVGTEPSPDFRFAASVATFGMILRGSEFKGSATLDTALDWAQQGKGADPDGTRAEFIELIRTAKALGAR